MRRGLRCAGDEGEYAFGDKLVSEHDVRFACKRSMSSKSQEGGVAWTGTDEEDST